MRVAVLVHGDPRFCAEFDHFLIKLAGYDQVDWFFYMWEKNEPTAFIVAGPGHKLISPFWQDVNRTEAIDRLTGLLPANHRICKFELGDQNAVTADPINTNFAVETVQSNVWKMWYGLHQVNKLRVEYEQENNFTYDIVIKTRPDVALMDQLDVQVIKQYVDRDPNLVLMPNNKRCGYGVASCDLFGMGSSKSMTAYADLYNQALDHHAKGIIFHPETMLFHHLRFNGINFQPCNFNIEFRWLGTWQNVETGQIYSSSEVPTWFGHIYLSNYGRWG